MEPKDDHKPDPGLIKRAAGIIRKGGVVVFPTSCLYGLCADAFNPSAIKRVFAVKKRPPDKPLLILIDPKRDLDKVAKNLSVDKRKVMDLFWPGTVTFVVDATDTLCDEITCGTGKIGIRAPACVEARALVESVGGPITGTSANISNRPAPAGYEDIDPELCDGVDLVVGAGTLAGGVGSTIVDLTSSLPEILREGTISKNDFFHALETGTTNFIDNPV